MFEAIPARKVMHDFYESHYVTQKKAAYMIGISEWLLKEVEQGGVTHPNIVKRIQKFYSLDDDQAEELLPENRRPHNPKYDPDRYVDIRDLLDQKETGLAFAR